MMPEDMPSAETRLAAALTALQQTPTVDNESVARVAARAVLANAPIHRATTWTMRAAAAVAVVALGAAFVRQASTRAGAESVAVASQDIGAAANRIVEVTPVGMTVTPVMATAARPIVFEFDAPDARSVQVLGDFNHWSRDVNLMQRGADGRWRVTTLLPPGRYVYAYLVDGRRFRRDPMRDAVEDHDFGVTGSELVVGEAP